MDLKKKSDITDDEDNMEEEVDWDAILLLIKDEVYDDLEALGPFKFCNEIRHFFRIRFWGGFEEENWYYGWWRKHGGGGWLRCHFTSYYRWVLGWFRKV